MQRIKEIINDRPVGILLPGHSAKILEDNIWKLSDTYCWIGINKFSVMEMNILHKVDLHFEIAFIIADGFFDDSYEMAYIRRFLERPERNLVITKCKESVRNRYPDDMVNKYPDKVLLANEDAKSGGISLSILLKILEREGCKKVVLFGADGYSDNKNEPYYRNNEQYPVNPKTRTDRQPPDTQSLNETHKIGKMPVLNCNMNSHYETFKKIEIGELCG